MQANNSRPITKRVNWLIDHYEGGVKNRFAVRVGVPPGHMYGWISGKSAPKGEWAKKICDAYGVTMEWLNGEGDDIPSNEPIREINKTATAPQATTPTPPPTAPPAPAPLDTTALEQLVEYRTEARIYKKLYEDQMARLDTTLTNIERAMTEQEHHEETADADAEATRRRQPETKPRKFGFSKAKNGDPIYTRGRKVVKEPH